MTNLSILNLRYQKKITGRVSALHGLTNLIHFNIAGCDNVDVDLHEVIYFTNLEILGLQLQENSGSLSELAILSNLMDIELQGREGEYDIGYLGQMTDLTVISLNGACFIGDISSFQNLNNLERLQMIGCRNVVGEIGTLSGLDNLGWGTMFSGCDNLTGTLVVNDETITAND